MRKCRGMALLMVLVALAVMMSVAAGLSVRYHALMSETAQLLDSFQARWYARASDTMAVKIIKQDISDSGGSVNLSQYWAQEGRTFPVEAERSAAMSATSRPASTSMPSIPKSQARTTSRTARRTMCRT